MKQWNFTRENYDCTLTIHDNAKVTMKINDDIPFKCKDIDERGVVFYIDINMEIQGESKKIKGFSLKNHPDILEYYNNLKKDIQEKEKRRHDEEYKDLMSGKKPLSISYHDGEYLQGYTAYGIDAEVIHDLYCGRYVDGWGFHVNKEFEDGDIEKMKAHFQEVDQKRKESEEKVKREKSQHEEEKTKMLDGVQWDIKEHVITDEGGKTYEFYHELIINGKTYKFCERNVFDFGLVINPMYAVAEGLNEGGLLNREDDKYFWQDYKERMGWYNVRELEEDELKAYLIVQKYGKFINSGIRM